MAISTANTMLGLALLTVLGAAPAQAASSCASYADDLAAMRDAAESLRRRVDYLAPPDDLLAANRIDQLALMELSNVGRLQALLENCGWPRRQADGPQAASLAWALAQSASKDLRFQKRLLRHLETAVANGDAPARQLAIVADRVALLEKRPQPYGTQLRQVDACTWDFEPLDDTGAVEARRKAAGLPPLEEYKRGINALVTPENCTTAQASRISLKQR